MDGPSRVLVVSARIGAGHDGAASELCARLGERGIATDMVDFLDAAPRSGGLTKGVFRLWLRWTPWLYDIAYRMWVVAPFLYTPMVVLLSAIFGRRLRRWIADGEPRAVVSTYPLASVVLGHLRSRGRIEVPVATFLTDFSVHPLWVGRGIDLHLCVHSTSADAIRKMASGPVVAAGPMVAPCFREQLVAKDVARALLGVPEDSTVVLVTAGSWGVGQIEATFDDLVHDPRHFVMVACGNNERLLARLAGRPEGMAIGWTDRMPMLMSAADVLVQNAGGLTAMEAFSVGLPVISYRPIPGHGRDNALAMERAGVAPFARDQADLLAMVRAAASGTTSHARRARSIFVSDAADHVADMARSGDLAGALQGSGRAYRREAAASLRDAAAPQGRRTG